MTVGGEVDVVAALRELEARQDRYRNMISTMPFPIWQVDATAADRLIMRPGSRRLRAGSATSRPTWPTIPNSSTGSTTSSW